MNIPDHISESLETNYLNSLMLFRDSDQNLFDPGIRDPGCKNSDPGLTSRIRSTATYETLICGRYDEDEAIKARGAQEKSRAALQRYLFYCNR